MASGRKNILIGWAFNVTGLATLLLFIFDISDGVLHGSASEGITFTGSPKVFILSICLKLGLAAFLLYTGVGILRKKD